MIATNEAHDREALATFARGGRIRHDRAPDAGSPSTDRPPRARPRWPTSSPLSCARRAAKSSARRSKASFSPGHSAIGAASYCAEACQHDSFDYDALHRVLLDPLGPGGDRRFQQAVYDYCTDTALSQPVTTAPADAVLLFDGVFLCARS